MDSFQQETIKIALDEMFNGSSHFSICDVDKLSKILGSNCKSHPDYKFLSALHCVDFSSMSSDLKTELPNRVMNVLSTQFDTGLMSKALLAVSNGEVKDLPPIEDIEVIDKPRLRLFKMGK